MGLRWRQMQAKNVRECAEIIAAHPIISPRYRRAIHDLRLAWMRLLGSQAMITAVFEEVEGARSRTWGVGVAVFVNDDFIREVTTPPLFWFGPELAKRVMRGSSPILSDSQVRKANSGEGLNLLVWESVLRPEFANRPDVYQLMMSAFLELHRGFLLKEMITSQSESVQRLGWAVDAGGFYWDSTKACYVKSLKGSAEEFIRKPHTVGITRELELNRPGSWVGTLFEYHPPRFRFSPSEQRLLLTALGGEIGTDQDLANALGVSLPTVKKMWLSVYRRVADRQPEIVRHSPDSETETSKRGKEKRRHLLAYLREHPEELRPISQKLLGWRPPDTKTDCLRGIQS